LGPGQQLDVCCRVLVAQVELGFDLEEKVWWLKAEFTFAEFSAICIIVGDIVLYLLTLAIMSPKLAKASTIRVTVAGIIAGVIA
jgi:hypothetical protein